MSTEIRLTDDADYMLCVLYDAYRARRKTGKLLLSLGFLVAPNVSRKTISSNGQRMILIDDAAQELSQKGLASCLFADNTLSEFALERDGIAFMEHRFGDKLDDLAQRIAALRSMFFG